MTETPGVNLSIEIQLFGKKLFVFSQYKIIPAGINAFISHLIS